MRARAPAIAAIRRRAREDPLEPGRHPARRAATRVFPCLQIHLPDGRVHSFSLNLPRSSIGRSGSNHLVISDLALSKKHALITRKGTDCHIQDAGSRNGTYLNDARISGPAPLAHGDVIRIGSCRLYYFTETVIHGVVESLEELTTRTGRVPFKPDPAGFEEPTGFSFSQQLALAHVIQKCLLPSECPEIPGYEICADSKPCYAVGGDFFDFQLLDDGRFRFLVGDVARKGIPSAMMAHYAQALVRGAWTYEERMNALIDRVNRDVWLHSPPNQFLTMCICQLELDTGELCYVNAGHCTPLLVHDTGEVEWLEDRSLALGIRTDADFQGGKAKIPPGSMLVLYSDGVTECRCEEGSEYQAKRLAEFCQARVGGPMGSFIPDLLYELEHYCAGPTAEDDITIVALRRDK